MWLRLILIFILGVLFQLSIINNLSLGPFFNPLVYSLIILKLPFKIQNWALLIWAFVLGLTIDIFQNSHGINAAASVFMAFSRPFVINLLTLQRDFGDEDTPSIRDRGSQWYIFYSLILLLVHHFIVFMLEEWSVSGLGIIFMRSLLSAGLAFGLLLMTEYLFFVNKN